MLVRFGEPFLPFWFFLCCCHCVAPATLLLSCYLQLPLGTFPHIFPPCTSSFLPWPERFFSIIRPRHCHLLSSLSLPFLFSPPLFRFPVFRDLLVSTSRTLFPTIVTVGRPSARPLPDIRLVSVLFIRLTSAAHYTALSPLSAFRCRLSSSQPSAFCASTLLAVPYANPDASVNGSLHSTLHGAPSLAPYATRHRLPQSHHHTAHAPRGIAIESRPRCRGEKQTG